MNFCFVNGTTLTGLNWLGLTKWLIDLNHSLRLGFCHEMGFERSSTEDSRKTLALGANRSSAVVVWNKIVRKSLLCNRNKGGWSGRWVIGWRGRLLRDPCLGRERIPVAIGTEKAAMLEAWNRRENYARCVQPRRRAGLVLKVEFE